MGDLVDLGGYRLYLECGGAGTPTVVLEAGMGDASGTWNPIFPQIATFTRVCRYDRAGRGRSDPAPAPRRTSQLLVADLHRLLSLAAVPGPYLLVGHSFGGVNVLLYAHRYPDEVVGLVLVDSAHPDQDARCLALLPPESAAEPAELQRYRRFLLRQPGDTEFDPEGIDWPTSMAEGRAVRSLGALPLVVLTAVQTGWPTTWPPELVAQLDQDGMAMQRELVSLSTNGRHIVAADSGHYMQYDQPQLIVDTIRELVARLRQAG
jgi:pimeloyl-ACP methyl ester carboxylesterase